MLFSAAVFIVLGQSEVVKLSNEKNFRIGAYDDASEKGNSRVKKLPDGDFELTVGKQSAQSLSGVYIQKHDQTLFELNEGKVIDLVLSTDTDLNVHLSFEKLMSDGQSTRPFHANSVLLFNTKSNSHRISLSEFKTPEWWLKKHAKSNKNISVSDSLTRFNIEFKNSGDKIQSRIIGIENVSIMTEGNSLQLPVGGGLFFVGLILLLIPQKLGANGSNQPKGNNENPIVYYVNKNLYNRSLTINSISEHFKLSADYINDRMKTETGLDSQDYINQKRVEKAKELLKSSDEKIAEIAQLCGFNSLSEFSETFKVFTGVMPKEFRDRINSLPSD